MIFPNKHPGLYLFSYHAFLTSYYYMVPLAVLVRYNGKHIFPPAENNKTWSSKLGPRYLKETWGGWGRVGELHIGPISLDPSILYKGNCRRCKWAERL